MHRQEDDVQVPCLSGILDLQRMCQEENVKFSSETNRYLVYLMLKKVGPMMASKLLDRLMESGEILWDKDEKYEVEAVVDHTDDEVITNEEAERRGKRYDAEGRTYLFDLDYNDGDCPFTVDAGYYGNVSHFVNHSCDPNLEVFGVWINTLDPRLPRIALFAKRDIAKGEELTFDYMMTVDANQSAFNTSTSSAMADPSSPGANKGDDHTNEPVKKLPSRMGLLSHTTDCHGNDTATTTTANNNNNNNDEESSTIPAAVAAAAAPTGLAEPPAANSDNSQVTQPHDNMNGTGDDDNSSSTEAVANTVDNASLPEGQGSEAPTTLPRNDAKITEDGKQYRIVCQCGAANCRKYLF
uniref:SET domain-containing protein n=1 Tax=Octopus bimaculoides TaxID=37653 RepID=A0A0L8G9I8_OCTBM